MIAIVRGRVAADLTLFAACLPGLEPVLLEEVRAAVAASAQSAPGGVQWTGDLASMYRANLQLGLASHVLLRVGEFSVRSLGELVRKVAQLGWEEWVAAGEEVAVRATCRRSRLYHTGAVQQRVVEGIARRLGARGARSEASTTVPAAEPITVVARLAFDRCQLSIDTSGAPLHRRGWRRQPGAAPVRADLARAALRTVGWAGDGLLVDPLAGVGTIAIEAAQLARGMAPGRMRSFAFERGALCDAALWQQVRAAADARVRPAAEPCVFASDRDARAIDALRDHAAHAGVAEDVSVEQAPLSAAGVWARLPARGALVTHPPFGRRLGDRGGLRPLYRALGGIGRQLPPAWRLAWLAGDRRLARSAGISLRPAWMTDHGGAKVWLLVGGAALARGAAGAYALPPHSDCSLHSEKRNQ